ncbi:hypothetical protein Y058_20130, partial [Vibrio mimicus]
PQGLARMAFSVLVSIRGYGCLVKPCGSVASSLSGRYVFFSESQSEQDIEMADLFPTKFSV